MLANRLIEGLQESKLLCFGWSLAYYVEEDRSVTPPTTDPIDFDTLRKEVMDGRSVFELSDSPPAEADPRLSTTANATDDDAKKARQLALLARLERLAKPYTAPIATPNTSSSFTRPPAAIVLRSNEQSKVVFALHPDTRHYVKLIADYLEVPPMEEDYDWCEGDLASAGYEKKDGPLVNGVPFGLLRPMPLEGVLRKSTEMALATAHPAIKGTATALSAVNISSDPTLLLSTTDDFTSEWDAFYAEHCLDEMSTRATNGMGEGYDGASEAAEQGKHERTKKREDAELLVSPADAPRDDVSSSTTNDNDDVVVDDLPTPKEITTGPRIDTLRDYRAHVAAGRHLQTIVYQQLMQSVKAMKGAGRTATTTTPPIVIDMNGYDDHVIALVAAYAHMLVVRHQVLAAEGFLRDPAVDLGWRGPSAAEANEASIGADYGDTDRDGGIDGKATTTAVSLINTTCLAYTKIPKPAPNLCMEMFYGALDSGRSGHYPRGMLFAANDREREHYQGDAPDSDYCNDVRDPRIPMLPYEAAAMRQYLLPFLGCYRRPINPMQGSRAEVMRRLEEIASYRITLGFVFKTMTSFLTSTRMRIPVVFTPIPSSSAAAAMAGADGTTRNKNTTTARAAAEEEAKAIIHRCEQTEGLAIVRAISRTTSLMNAANFIQFQPLVEVCGLGIAMTIAGRSPADIRKLFSRGTSYRLNEEGM